MVLTVIEEEEEEEGEVDLCGMFLNSKDTEDTVEIAVGEDIEVGDIASNAVELAEEGEGEGS